MMSRLGWGVFSVEKNKYICYNVSGVVLFERMPVMNERKLAPF